MIVKYFAPKHTPAWKRPLQHNTMTIAEASIVAAHLKVKLDFFSSFHILFHLQEHSERQKKV